MPPEGEPLQRLQDLSNALRRHDEERASLAHDRDTEARHRHNQGATIASLARATRLSRETIYKILKRTP